MLFNHVLFLCLSATSPHNKLVSNFLFDQLFHDFKYINKSLSYSRQSLLYSHNFVKVEIIEVTETISPLGHNGLNTLTFAEAQVMCPFLGSVNTDRITNDTLILTEYLLSVTRNCLESVYIDSHGT